MKTGISLLTMILLIGCNSCQTEDPKPKTELEKLPPATQEGKDTFGCLINGKAWYAKTTSNVLSDYQLGSLSVSAHVYEPFQSLGISLWEKPGLPPLTEGVYSLVSTTDYSPWLSFNSSMPCYYGGTSNDRGDTLDGTITITKFDKTNYIISGFFEGALVHNGCENLTITNGRFDIRYVP